MAEDMILLQRISMDTDQDIRSASKISGLFSSSEIENEAKDVFLKDFQRDVGDHFECNSLSPMPYYETPQHVQQNAELDIPKPSVLHEADWDLGSFDVENNIDCDIFAELSDLTTTMTADEVTEIKPELTPVASKSSGGRVTVGIRKPASDSPSSALPSVRRDISCSFLDHNYAAVVAKIPAVNPSVENACAAPSERGVGENVVSKITKYVERRKKNNLASRRSRETRKRKCVEMEEEVFRLERKNEELRNRIAKMEWMSCTLKRSLFGKVDVPDHLLD